HVREDADLRQALLHELPRLVDVRAALEGEDYRRETGNGLRADRLRALDPVQQVLFHRDGDQLFDLGRGEAEALRLHLDDRSRELREHVDRRLLRPRGPDCKQNCSRQHDEQPQPDACSDDSAEHVQTSRTAARALRPCWYMTGSEPPLNLPRDENLTKS